MTNELKRVLDAHEVIFPEQVGNDQLHNSKLQMDPQVPLKFHTPRPVPFSLRQKVDDEQRDRREERLERAGIICPRQFSQWVAPIVAVPKRDGSISICGDYKAQTKQ